MASEYTKELKQLIQRHVSGDGGSSAESKQLFDAVNTVFLRFQMDRASLEHAMNSRLTTIIQNLQAGILVEDETRRVSLINRQFCMMFHIGVLPESLFRVKSSTVLEAARVHFADPALFIRRMDEIITLKASVSGEILDTVDGRTFERDFVPMFVGTAYKGHVWQYRDITGRKIAEDSIRLLNKELVEANRMLRFERDREKEHVVTLEKLNQMKSEFVSSVSHELRTPLASILGFAETVYLDPSLAPETQREFLQIILEEAQRLAKLINDLLDLSRVENGKTEIERTEADIVPVAQHVLSLIATEAENKGLKVTADFESPSIIVPFDKDRMTQILINLLSNAVKFTLEGGFVSLVVRRAETMLEITVRDTGMGIPQSDMQFLFNKFFRVYRPGLQIRGTGLGLAIVKHLVELHGGTIHVESEESKGSQFTVQIPL